VIAPDRFWMTMMPHTAAILIVLAIVAWLAPPPQPTDQAMVEYVGQGVINPGCADLNCFRVLVPAAVESLPGPSLPRWRAYAVVMNAAAAVATGWLALELGLPAAAITLTVWLSALGAGSFSTVYHPYNADSFVLFLAPVITVLLLRQRMLAAGIVSAIGIFAKEFAAVPLYVAAAASALQHRWRECVRRAGLAVAVTLVWVALQLTLMQLFAYSYNANPSSQPLAGGYLRLWLAHVTPATAVFALFGAFGALYLLLPFGWRLAPRLLRQLAIGSIPALLAFVLVATPERALWNFYFIAVPIGALALAALPAGFTAAFVALFAMANLRIGAQVPDVPSSRYALVATVLIAAAAAWRSLALNPATAAVEAID
jgi:hypothetical protein